MVSGEFYPVARLLDWSEVRVRELARWVGGVWGASAADKVLTARAGRARYGYSRHKSLTLAPPGGGNVDDVRRRNR
jgi:hypothetical protein